jgi:hypothetical protein
MIRSSLTLPVLNRHAGRERVFSKFMIEKRLLFGGVDCRQSATLHARIKLSAANQAYLKVKACGSNYDQYLQCQESHS